MRLLIITVGDFNINKCMEGVANVVIALSILILVLFLFPSNAPERKLHPLLIHTAKGCFQLSTVPEMPPDA